MLQIVPKCFYAQNYLDMTQFTLKNKINCRIIRRSLCDLDYISNFFYLHIFKLILTSSVFYTLYAIPPKVKIRKATDRSGEN